MRRRNCLGQLGLGLWVEDLGFKVKCFGLRV